MGWLTGAELVALGVEAANLLCRSGTSYRAFLVAAQHIARRLAPAVSQVQLYTADQEQKLLREEAIATCDTVMEGGFRLPYYQLPSAVMEGYSATFPHGLHHETLVPLQGEGGLLGMVAFTSAELCPRDTLGELSRFGAGVALGLQWLATAREVQRLERLRQAAIVVGRELIGLTEAESLLVRFPTLVVEQFGLDRATLVIFGSDTAQQRAFCKVAGRPVTELSAVPAVPPLSSEGVPLEHVPGFWLPLQAGTSLLGALLVDNLYTLTPPSEELRQLLADLCGQAALALENTRLLQRLREAALRDDLTKLYRPNFFYERVREELVNARSRGTSACLLMLDVDHFKHVNDTYGHVAGDAVLVQLADVIRRSLRAGDIACRMGGDEFIILVPDIDVAQGYRIAERLLNHIKSHRFTVAGGRSLSVTVSLGVATINTEKTGWQQVLQEVDAAMYQAKNQGRARVSVADSAVGSSKRGIGW